MGRKPGGALNMIAADDNRPLFEKKSVDRSFYEERLKDFLPDGIIDVHTHIWMGGFRVAEQEAASRGASWPARVAGENPLGDLLETYGLLFPDKKTTPVIFGNPERQYDIGRSNDYVRQSAAATGFPSLLLTLPEWDGDELERRVLEGGFHGCKAYLNYAPGHIPENEITIFDFLPLHQLEVIDRRGWVVMLHIPRPGRLRDPVNLAQLLEIERSFPGVRLIVAHVGRAYCDGDAGDAFRVLAGTKRMMFDFSANTNEHVFGRLIDAVGPGRILFGSDLPITRMRMRRICECGNYVNLVPAGLYGDISGDRHMRAAGDGDAERLTFFLYEQIDSFRRASERTGLSRSDIGDVFYSNAAKLFDVRGGRHGKN